ncbi:MAG: Com family DNA-binding transcriptional regulator [Candidatus Peregrinibacteria bacterium]
MEPHVFHYLDYRCQSCHKLLFKGMLVDSEVEVKCKRCSEVNIFKGEPKSRYLCLKGECPNRIACKS